MAKRRSGSSRRSATRAPTAGRHLASSLVRGGQRHVDLLDALAMGSGVQGASPLSLASLRRSAPTTEAPAVDSLEMLAGLGLVREVAPSELPHWRSTSSKTVFKPPVQALDGSRPRLALAGHPGPASVVWSASRAVPDCLQRAVRRRVMHALGVAGAPVDPRTRRGGGSSVPRPGTIRAGGPLDGQVKCER